METDLRKGDESADGSIVVVDEDRLCYRIKSISNGAIGIRTISKKLLAEWVTAYKRAPNESAEDVRKRLRGKSEIDRYEYGYAGSLAKMAKMALGQIPVIHPNLEDKLKTDFYNWMIIDRGLSKSYAGDCAGSCLTSLSDELKMPPTKTAWHGLREYLYGRKPTKSIYEVSCYDELMSEYGALDRIFDSVKDSGELDVAKFQQCWNWAHNTDNHNSVKTAWLLFKQFMQWREAQQKTKEEPLPVLPAAGRLSIVLNVFAEKRSVLLAVGEKNYDEYYAEARTEAARIDGDYLVSCDYEAFRNTLNARQVANSFFSRHTDDDKRRLGDFIAAVRQDPRDISFYLAAGNQPNVSGVGPAMLTAFLTRTRPDLFVFFTEQMFESVKFLGLTAEEALPALFTDAYNTYKGIQTAIRDRMRQMGIKAENGNDADYLTVNEFTWFVSDHLDEIKEAIMKQEFKNAPKKPKDGQRKLADAVKGDAMLQRLMAALRTKPFAILAGHSGTGKSQLVRRLAYMTCNDQTLWEEAKEANAPGNYCMVQVKPNWHDSTDLLGYYTEMNGGKYHTTKFVEFICKAYAYPETPFFACLDEMNLAPVEQYFAEFLSAIESYSDKTGITDRLITEKAEADEICGETKFTESLEEVKKHGLTIPRNLFVVGTVNVDETTCQFSRKVLDRAMTILMTAVSFQSMTGENDPANELCLDPDGIRFFLERPSQTALVKGQMDKLDSLQQSVGDSAFAIAYRFPNEYALYQTAFQTLMAQGLKGDGQPDANDEASQETALDHVALMKLLPRIHGEKRTVEGIFAGLKSKLKTNGLSAAMMDAILKRNDEYLTFWP